MNNEISALKQFLHAGNASGSVNVLLVILFHTYYFTPLN